MVAQQEEAMRQIDTNWAYEQYSTIVRNTINGDDTYYGRYAELMVLEVGIKSSPASFTSGVTKLISLFL